MIAAIVPLKEKSIRVPFKNFREFADTNLADHKLRQLSMVEGLDKIIINTESKNIAERYKGKFEIIFRDPIYATGCSGSEFFEEIARTATADTVIYSPVTAPFIKPETLDTAIEMYKRGEYDRVVSVVDLQDHIWMRGKPINYETYNMPNSQDLPKTYKITYGFSILSRELMQEDRNIINDKGSNYFYELDEIEGIDIDTMLDFRFAEYVYENGLCSM